MTNLHYSAPVGRNPKPSPNERAAWVRTVRRGAGLSQDAFAAEIGVERTTVSNWERGRYVPEWASIEKILKRFNNAERPTFGADGEMSDPGSTMAPTPQPGGIYIVKTDQGRIIAKMLDGIDDETERTRAMKKCLDAIEQHPPSELGADDKANRAQRNR